MIETGHAPPAVVAAKPRRLVSEAAGVSQVRQRLPFGRRRVTDGTVRLPTVMTFVVVLFAATLALVSFGYVATREWRSGTNQLLERRANEAAALVRATLSADMKGAWITAIVPFNTTVLDEEPPYGLFQVAARAFARYPYPESFVLWKRTGVTYAFNRADRPPPWNTQPSSDDPFPVVLVRDPAELAGLVAAVREQATAASPFLVIERSIEGTPYQVVAHALFASSPPHHLLGFMAFTVNTPWVRAQVLRSADQTGGEDGRQPRRPVVLGVGRRGASGHVGAGRIRRHGRSAHPVPPAVHRPGTRQVDRLAAGARPRVDRPRPLAARPARSSLRWKARGGCSSLLPSPPAPACWRSCSR